MAAFGPKDYKPTDEVTYLMCHGEALAEEKADLSKTTVGVYNNVDDFLAWRDIRHILKDNLLPIFRPTNGECPEIDLAPLSAFEQRLWKKYGEGLLKKVDLIEQEATLSDYISGFEGCNSGKELRLLVCAGMKLAKGVSLKEGAPPSWRSSAALPFGTHGALSDRRADEDLAVKTLKAHCQQNWQAAKAHLNGVTERINMFALYGGGPTLVILMRDMEDKIPAVAKSIYDWIPFLQQLTPDAESAQEIYEIWAAARADGYPAVADFLEGRCGLIDEALATDDQAHDAAMEQACVRGFAATGWARMTRKRINQRAEVGAGAEPSVDFFEEGLLEKELEEPPAAPPAQTEPPAAIAERTEAVGGKRPASTRTEDLAKDPV